MVSKFHFICNHCIKKYLALFLPRFIFCVSAKSEMSGRRANNGVSQYPSYQKSFQLAENFQNIYRTLSKLGQIFLEIPLYLRQLSMKLFR